MRLVLIHGINQQGRKPDELKEEWIGWLKAAMPDSRILANCTVTMPFYGKVLDQLTQGVANSFAVAQGAAGLDTDELNFIASAMNEAAVAAGISARDISLEQRSDSAGAIEQGGIVSRQVNAVARLLERWSPAHGQLLLPLVRQAYAYLRRPGVAPAIDAVVMPVLEAGPTVIVSHSLGTVISFKLLRALAQAGRPLNCPLFITLGSPIALQSVSTALGVPFAIPPGVMRWVNAVEPGDKVTLGKALDASTFCSGIENIMDIDNDSGGSLHDVQGYLSDRRIAARVEMALR